MTMTVDKIVEGVADSAGLRPFASTNGIHKGKSNASNHYELLLDDLQGNSNLLAAWTGSRTVGM
jgi:hypothetical protein